VHFLSRRGRHSCVAALCGFLLAGCALPQPAPALSAAQLKARAGYAELLQRVQQGDMSVDFSAFRIAGAIVAGSRISAVEVADRAALKKFMAESNPQAALDSSNRTLGLDYASTIAHFDAMMACRALNQPNEAAKHEKLLNALLDSIAKAGDGKTPETSYLAATTQEEYIFMALRLNLNPKGQQSLIIQKGHYYDLLKVIDPSTNTTQDLWFNADVQINPDGNSVPNPTSASKDSTKPVVVAAAQMIVPAPSTTKGAGMQGSAAKNPPSTTGGDRLRQISGKDAENCGAVRTRTLEGNKAIEAANDCVERAFAQTKPFYVLYSDSGIDTFFSFGLTMGADGVMYQTFTSGGFGPNRNSITPCDKPVQLKRNASGELRCLTSSASEPGNSSKDAPAVTHVQSRPNDAGTQPGKDKSTSLKTERADDAPHTIEAHAQLSQPQTLYDQDGVSVIATETQDTLELAVSEPDPILVSVEIDRNQNGQFDRLVDVAYRPQANGNLCPQYLIDSQHNTPCGGFASHAYLKDFKDNLGRREFVLVLPKKEISFDLPSARLALVFRDSAQRHTSNYPPERFQKAINIPYLINQVGAVQAGPTQNDSMTQGSVGKIATSEQIAPTNAGPTNGQSVKQYTPSEQGFGSHLPMNIRVTRTDAGYKYHFAVDFTVPHPPSSFKPTPYLFNLITVYGNQIHDGHRVNLSDYGISSIAGDWKPGNRVHLECDLLKERADPLHEWNLRFCVGSNSSCIPSPNLLVENTE